MNRIEEQLEQLKNVRLTTEVRLRMREELLSYASLHSVHPVPLATRSWHIFSVRLYAGFAAVLVLIGGVGGTALASENSLPGETLYSFKVKVSEPIQTALVPSERGKAAWHAILAERRLEEATQLAVENKLSPDTQEELAVNFDEHINASVESANNLEEHGDTHGSLSARSDLEARLSAHSQILHVIAAHYAQSDASTTDPTHIALLSLISKVEEHEAAASTARVALEDQLVPTVRHSIEGADTLAKGGAPAASMTGAAREGEHGFAAEDVDHAEVIRTKEVEHILERNALMLAKFQPTATTSTSTQATSTKDTNKEGEVTTSPEETEAGNE